jgi:hypothetical protein
LLRFDSSKRPARNYTSRREQWRLLLLVMSLGVVILAIRQVRQPKTAQTLAHVFSDQNKPVSVEGTAVVAPTVAVAPAIDSPSPGDVPRDALNVVRDNTYFRTAEAPAWFGLIARLQELSEEELRSRSLGDITYVQLVDQPASYRAEILTVRGTARQLTAQTPAENELGLKSYYLLEIQPSDGTQWPIFVYCLDLPDDFPKNEDPNVDVTATGYFFKNLSYPWQGGLGIAPVILAKTVSIESESADPSTPAAAAPTPLAAGPQSGTESSEASTSQHSGSGLRQMLELAGWNAERFSRFMDDQPVDDEEQSNLLELLWRVRSFDAASIQWWTRSGVKIEQAWENPRANRGEMVRLSRNVVGVRRHELSDRDAARLEMPAYFTCEMALAGSPYRAIVITPTVPQDWLTSDNLNEPASASAVFVKRIALPETAPEGEPSNESTMLLVAKRIAWHPRSADYPRVSLGESMLGHLGFDVGLLEDVESRGAIRAAEREPFYQMLRASGRIDAAQLIRAAHDNLGPTRARWAKELSASPVEPRGALAREVIRRADEGCYSVAPLFNQPKEHKGELAVFDGVARRVVRVDVGTRPDGHASEVANRFGFREYYEMEVFTDDSQNYPLVFCFRELPPELATGGALEVPVRIAGFFFKNWLYTTRGTRNDEPRDGEPNAPRAQYAPLLIGRGPILLQIERQENQVAQWVMGGVFLLALAGVWATAWWFARGDRQFAARTRGAGFSLPAAQSLNDLKVPAANEPINFRGDADFNTVDSQ